MNFVETKSASKRFVNLKEMCQILVKKDDYRVSFNFTSIVEKTDNSGKILPAFHYVDFSDNKESMKAFNKYVKEAQKKGIPVFVFDSGKYIRAVNFDKVNSFYLKEDEEGFNLFINFSTSISSEIIDGLTEHSIKITEFDKNKHKEFTQFLKESNIAFF